MRLKNLRLFLISFFAVFSLSVAQPRVGMVELYGAKKVTADKVRKAIAISPGDAIPRSKVDLEELITAVNGVVRASVSAVCCEEGKAILFVGMQERGTEGF